MNRRRKYVLEVDRAKMYKTPGIRDRLREIKGYLKEPCQRETLDIILDAMSTGEGKRP